MSVTGRALVRTPHRLGREALAAAARRCLALLLALLASAAAAGSAHADVRGGPVERGIATWLEHSRQADDDPRAVVQDLGRRLATTVAADERYWLLLAKARAHTWLEEYAEQQATVELAAAVLRTNAVPGPVLERQRLWLRLEQINTAVSNETPAQVQGRVAALREDVAKAGDAVLGCILQSLEMWLLIDASSLDEAWLAAESVERCAAATGIPGMKAVALSGMGQIAAEARFDPSLGRDPADFFERALVALAPHPARWRRSLIEWDFGNAMRRAKKLDAALVHLQRALELSHALGDRAGVAAANIAIARTRIDQESWRDAITLLDGAIALLQGHDNGPRMAAAHELKIRAMAQLKQPAVLAVIQAARAWDKPELQPSVRAALALAMGEGYASQQAWSRAYDEMQRAHALERDGRGVARDSQVLRLQARYDTMRREAENAQLRHNAELARVALERAAELRQRLAVTAALLALLAAIGIGFASRLWLRRRAYAALALRDELTGSPNRRAVSFYAQAQFEQARSLNVPMTLALLDLDHFKRVNDRWGHATGDAVLKAFAQALQPVLRGQDRLGRWGGEEWLLVLPGTRVDELPRLFDRLRTSLAQTAMPGLPQPHGVSFSMGGAAVDEHSASLNEVIELADRRLYRAKESGRDRVCWAD